MTEDEIVVRIVVLKLQGKSLDRMHWHRIPGEGSPDTGVNHIWLGLDQEILCGDMKYTHREDCKNCEAIASYVANHDRG